MQPIVTYSAKAWTLINTMKIAIVTGERKITRQICGPTYAVVTVQ